MGRRFAVGALWLALPSVAVQAGQFSVGALWQTSTTCFQRTYVDTYWGGESPQDTCNPRADPRASLDFRGGGLLVGLALDPHLALVTGARLSRKGFLHYFKGGYRYLHFPFVELPVQLRYEPWPEAEVTPYLIGGGYGAVRVDDASIDLLYSAPEIVYEERRTQWARAELGVTIGAGVAVRLAYVELFGQVDLGRGLTDLYAGADWKDKGRFVRASVGLMIWSGKRPASSTGP